MGSARKENGVVTESSLVIGQTGRDLGNPIGVKDAEEDQDEG
jgi:hypothetical protein